jgi:tRNA threonylcarbamoyladenosine biosynthesis protein TsaB
MCKLAAEAFAGHNFEDVAYFEPFYLKDFLTSKPVKNVLRN